MSHLKCALITSFSTAGIFEDGGGRIVPSRETFRTIESVEQAMSPAEVAGGEATDVEVYLAMDADLAVSEQYIKSKGRVGNRCHPINAAEFLGSLNNQEVGRLAGAIDGVVRQGNEKRRVIGLATFLPEISRRNGPTSPARQNAENALANVMRVGRQLRKMSHPVEIVEIVAGSRFATLAEVVAPDPGDANHDSNERLLYEVNLDGDEEVRGRVLQSLERVLTTLEVEANLDEFPGIATELEPGPYFNLRDLESLEEFAKALEGNKTLKDRVGFNLDIAHWRIAKVPLEKVKAISSICDRIRHAHISGHHEWAHFGDFCMKERQWSDVKPWVDFLRELAARTKASKQHNHPLPRFSGYVSVEMEAAGKSTDIVEMVRLISTHLT